MIRNSFTGFLALVLSINICTAQVRSFKKTDFGLSFKLDKGVMNLYLLNSDLVEVKYTSLDKIPEKKSLVVLPVKSYLKIFSVKENSDNVVITTSKLKIKVNKKTNAVTYSDLNNDVILAEADA